MSKNEKIHTEHEITQDVRDSITQMNATLKELGLLELDIVRPTDCKPRDKNARYMRRNLYDIMKRNIGEMGALESTPLVHRIKEDKYEIISGHNRIKAAVDAQVEFMLVMIVEETDEEILTSKQLAHNALSGTDDEQVLFEIYESIKSVEIRLATGLQEEMETFQTVGLTFEVKDDMKSFQVLFSPEEIGTYDEAVTLAEDYVIVSSDTAVRVVPESSFSNFVKAISKIKRVEDIKSNGIAFYRLVELALERMAETDPTKKS